MLDGNLIFDGTVSGAGVSAGVAITASRVSTNIIDLLVARDVGAGEPLGIHVDVTEAFATLTSLVIDLEVCDTVGGTYLKILASPVYVLAQLTLNAPLFRYAFPVNQLLNSALGVLKAPPRYVQLGYTVAGSNATAGKVFSYLTPRQDRNEYYNYPIGYVANTGTI